MTFTAAQTATILAALRFWQTDVENNGGDYPGEFWDVAADCGAVEPLDVAQIDNLCEQLNYGNDTLSPDEEKRRMAIVKLTKSIHCEDGELEIDEDAKLSEGDDNGCYVAAWVWCPFDGTEFDKEVLDEN